MSEFLLQGYYFSPQSSARETAKLKLDHASFTLILDRNQQLTGDLQSLQFSDRVGNVPRKLRFTDGSQFVCHDNDQIDQFLSELRIGNSVPRILHNLESQSLWVVFALLFTIVFSASFVIYGVPWLSKKLAMTLPIAVNAQLGSGTLETLDKLALEETKLTLSKQGEIRNRFTRMLANIPGTKQVYTLHFRSFSGNPNAFALPSGDIVLTDALVNLAESPEEIDSVLLHEVGHVVHRHSLQQVIQASATTFIISMILGDSTAINDLAVALPVFLMEQKYSRSHEYEADTFSLDEMQKQGIDPKFFGIMMGRLSDFSSKDKDGETTHELDLGSYLSSHPLDKDRIKRAEEHAK